MGRKFVQSGIGTLKHCFIELNQVAFWTGEEAENGFKVPSDHLKNRFIDDTQVAFWACQEAEKELQMPG